MALQIRYSTVKNLLNLGLVALLVALVLLWRHHSIAQHNSESVFVSVSSYRDRECAATILDLFQKAQDPTRVYMGIVAYTKPENKTAEEDCECPELAPYEKNIRRIKLNFTDAKGPTVARLLASDLYNGQAYFCNIDSHMKFAQDWEQKLISMLAECPSPKPVITHYPAAWEDTSVKEVPVICKSSWGKSGLLSFQAVLETAPRKGEFKPVPFAAGGFYFARAELLKDVPFDPNMLMLFEGEEMLYSGRMWTSGYDFFTPDENVIFHHYYREGAPKFWSDLWNHGYAKTRANTEKKVLELIHEKDTNYQYGFGKERSVKDYWKFAGLDPFNRTSRSGPRFCSSMSTPSEPLFTLPPAAAGAAGHHKQVPHKLMGGSWQAAAQKHAQQAEQHSKAAGAGKQKMFRLDGGGGGGGQGKGSKFRGAGNR